MADGARTHDHWNHNPGLYQLSYSHHNKKLSGCLMSSGLLKPHEDMARPAGFEPATTRLEGGCSIQLSYGRMLELKTLAGSIKMVGVEGFEPPTFCSQNRRATGLRYTPTT